MNNFNKTFVNFSNHPSSMWNEAQKKAAEEYGSIVDIAFPCVPADAGVCDIAAMADEYFNKIREYDPVCVMCMGEFTLAFAVYNRLKAAGIKVVVTCSERKANEYKDADGTRHKDSIFEFVQFREII